DRAHAAADHHAGCPSCPHPVTGPAVTGSPTVTINGLPALRVDDTGTQDACCGGRGWKAVGGSAFVTYNGKRAFRQGDPSRHGGGDGMLIEGSPNVDIGGPTVLCVDPTEADIEAIKAELAKYGVVVDDSGASWTSIDQKYQVYQAILAGITQAASRLGGPD